MLGILKSENEVNVYIKLDQLLSLAGSCNPAPNFQRVRDVGLAQ